MVEVPRGHTRGVTMSHLAGVAHDKDYVRAEEVPGVEASDSYMVFVEATPSKVLWRANLLGLSFPAPVPSGFPQASRTSI